MMRVDHDDDDTGNNADGSKAKPLLSTVYISIFLTISYCGN